MCTQRVLGFCVSFRTVLRWCYEHTHPVDTFSLLFPPFPKIGRILWLGYFTASWEVLGVNPNRRVPTRIFYCAPPTRSLPVVSNAPQGSPRGLSTERRRATNGSENLLLCWRTFWAAWKSSEGRILGGSSLQTTPSKVPIGKSTPGGYAPNVHSLTGRHPWARQPAQLLLILLHSKSVWIKSSAK